MRPNRKKQVPEVEEFSPLTPVEIGTLWQKQHIYRHMNGPGAPPTEMQRALKEISAYRSLKRVEVTIEEHHDSMGTAPVYGVSWPPGSSDKSMVLMHRYHYGIPLSPLFDLEAGQRFFVLVGELPRDPKVKPEKNPFKKCHFVTNKKTDKRCGRIGAEWCQCNKGQRGASAILLCDKHMSGHRCKKPRK